MPASPSPLHGLRRWLFAANRHPLWRTRRTVWGSRLFIPSGDRLLYATLHQLGLMGAADRRFYEAEIRPGMTVLDIGANIGLCSLLFARLVGPGGKVLAFEPAPELCGALREACREGAANVEVFPYGLSDADEDRELRRGLFNSGDNRVQAGDAVEDGAARISLRRGDGLLPADATADFIKIDVQGWELPALRGLQGLIDRSPRLQIYFEFGPAGLRRAGTDPAALLGYLSERGLKILRPLPGGGWSPMADFAAFTGSLSGEKYVNLRAVRAA